MAIIYGVGEPNQICESGVEYIDLNSGKRYNQTEFPKGNYWLLMGVSTESSGNSGRVFESKICYLEREMFESEISDILVRKTLWTLPAVDGFFYVIKNIKVFFTGTDMVSTGDQVIIELSNGVLNSDFVQLGNSAISTNQFDTKIFNLISVSKIMFDSSAGLTISIIGENSAPSGGDVTSKASFALTYYLIEK